MGGSLKSRSAAAIRSHGVDGASGALAAVLGQVGHEPVHGRGSHGVDDLAAGPALEARLGQRAETLPNDHPVWALGLGPPSVVEARTTLDGSVLEASSANIWLVEGDSLVTLDPPTG